MRAALGSFLLGDGRDKDILNKIKKEKALTIQIISGLSAILRHFQHRCSSLATQLNCLQIGTEQQETRSVENPKKTSYGFLWVTFTL